jgi:hypothetical protein
MVFSGKDFFAPDSIMAISRLVWRAGWMMQIYKLLQMQVINIIKKLHIK